MTVKKTNSVLSLIEQFISLEEEEKKLFLEVVIPKPKKTKKIKKSLLPPEFNQEVIYNKLIKNHNDKVAKRLKRNQNKSTKKPS